MPRNAAAVPAMRSIGCRASEIAVVETSVLDVDVTVMSTAHTTKGGTPSLVSAATSITAKPPALVP